MNTNYTTVFAEIFEELKGVENTGRVAQYIPELSVIDPSKFGVSLVNLNEDFYSFGDADEKFSIQSIAKVLSLTMAYNLIGEKLWDRVGVEPSGTAFNSLVQLEFEKGIPRNPFINPGALVVADILVSVLENPKRDFLTFVNKLSF